MNAYVIIESLKLMLNIINYVVMPIAVVTLIIATIAIVKELLKHADKFKLSK